MAGPYRLINKAKNIKETVKETVRPPDFKAPEERPEPVIPQQPSNYGYGAYASPQRDINKEPPSMPGQLPPGQSQRIGWTMDLQPLSQEQQYRNQTQPAAPPFAPPISYPQTGSKHIHLDKINKRHDDALSAVMFKSVPRKKPGHGTDADA